MKVLAIIPFSVPGITIGIGYALCYSSFDVYKTYLPLICANIIHFFGIPYFLFFNNFSLMDNEIEITAKIFRLNWLSVLFRIYIPQMKQTIVESMLIYFINSMVTISAVIMLFRTSTMPLAILITQFEAQLLIYYASAATTIIFIVNVTIKLIAYIIPRQKN